MGFRQPCLQSPPSPMSSAPVDLAHAAWSTPVSFVGASVLALRCLRCSPHDRIGWKAAATLMSPPCCAWPLVREHDAASSPVQLLDGGLAATTEAAPLCRHPGLLPCSSGSTPVSSSSPPSFWVLTLVAWPASQACLPILLLCHAVAVALLKLVLLLLLFCLSLCC
jgi:hypothetical protein